MKTIFTTLFFFLFTSLFFLTSAQQVIYVKHNATGDSTGTSWANAHPDLQDALDVANTLFGVDTIWVAEGTYKPDVYDGNSESTFRIQDDVELLGGFSGDGASPDERNPDLYPTILSGDLNGNDVVNDFETNREDNVNTVMTVNWGMTNVTIIDGFTIGNGHADDTQSSTGRNGGGIWSNGAPIIRNCIISQNYAVDIGGGIKASNIPFDGLIIENCVFDWNLSNLGGAADIRFCDVSFSDCTFSNNQATETIVQQLEKNGGGVFTRNSNCFYKNCNFISNSCNGGGGAFFYWTSGDGTGLTLEVDSCLFSNNSASGGGALFSQIWGKDQTVILTNSQFTNNQCNEWWGNVSIYNQQNGAYGNVLVDNCWFEDNTSVYAAGAVDIGSGPGAAPSEYLITNCTFKNNSADSLSGALTLWSEINTEANFQVSNCLFENNQADSLAGALLILTGDDGFSGEVSHCEFINNESKTGAAIAASTGELEEPNVPTEAQFILDNCLLSGNSGENTVAVKDFPDFQMINCTLADNESITVKADTQSNISIQNTILFNPGFQEFDSQSVGTITSLGGNLLSDNSHPMPQTSDIENSDPIFIGGGDFQVQEGSPCINAGINVGVTAEYDLAGNPRIADGIVDIGAYEKLGVAAREVITGDLDISPNPVSDFLYIQLPKMIEEPLSVSLFDFQGRLMNQQLITDNQAIDVGALAPGIYMLKAMDDDKIYTGKFIKL